MLGVVLRDLDEVVDDVGGFGGLGRRPFRRVVLLRVVRRGGLTARGATRCPTGGPRGPHGSSGGSGGAGRSGGVVRTSRVRVIVVGVTGPLRRCTAGGRGPARLLRSAQHQVAGAHDGVDRRAAHLSGAVGRADDDRVGGGHRRLEPGGDRGGVQSLAVDLHLRGTAQRHVEDVLGRRDGEHEVRDRTQTSAHPHHQLIQGPRQRGLLTAQQPPQALGEVLRHRRGQDHHSTWRDHACPRTLGPPDLVVRAAVRAVCHHFSPQRTIQTPSPKYACRPRCTYSGRPGESR